MSENRLSPLTLQRLSSARLAMPTQRNRNSSRDIFYGNRYFKKESCLHAFLDPKREYYQQKEKEKQAREARIKANAAQLLRDLNEEFKYKNRVEAAKGSQKNNFLPSI